MRISDWSSDVCSSDLSFETGAVDSAAGGPTKVIVDHLDIVKSPASRNIDKLILSALALQVVLDLTRGRLSDIHHSFALEHRDWKRSEEHTSELQSLMRISYAVFFLKKKTL